MSYFPNPGLDPHKEAIDGPTPDPWPADRRVKAARRAEWIADDQWDGDVLRPGWVERNLVAADPDPHYSRLDVLDGLDETVNPAHPPVPANSVPVQGVPHSMYEPMRRLYWVLAVVPVVGVVAVAFLFWRWVA